MRKFTALLMLTLLLGLMIVPSLFAQDGTAEPGGDATGEATVSATDDATSEATAQAGSTGAGVPLTHIRLAHFVSDGPSLNSLINGNPSGIQEIAYPAVTGWVEVPASQFTLSFVVGGDDESNAVVGPLVVGGFDTDYVTITLVGSASAGTIQAYAIAEDLSPVTAGSARVTVFHAIEGAPAIDFSDDTGVLAGGIGFPGTGSTNTAGTGVQCFLLSGEALGGSGIDAGATEDAIEDDEQDVLDSPDETAEAAGDNAGGNVGFGASTPDAGPTEDLIEDDEQDVLDGPEETAEAAGDNLGGNVGFGETSGTGGARANSIGNCASSVEVTAGTYNFNVFAAGTTDSALATLSGTEIAADTLYFIAVIGTADAPELFTFSVPASVIDAEDTATTATAEATEFAPHG